MTSSFTAISIGGLLANTDPLPRRVEIERIDVEAVAARSQQIHFQQVVAEILGESADAIAAVAQRDDDFLAFRTSAGTSATGAEEQGRRLLGG